MSQIKVPLLAVTIRRDANTITPVTVPPYELQILRANFGKENVTGDKIVGHREVDPVGEYDRMAAKYGRAKVAKVYGDDGGERLAELVEKAKATETKSKAKTETTEAAQ